MEHNSKYCISHKAICDDAFNKQISALKQSAGVWSLENHPELKDEKSIEKWLKESRKNWR